jgi:hypothetical protein
MLLAVARVLIVPELHRTFRKVFPLSATDEEFRLCSPIASALLLAAEE